MPSLRSASAPLRNWPGVDRSTGGRPYQCRAASPAAGRKAPSRARGSQAHYNGNLAPPGDFVVAVIAFFQGRGRACRRAIAPSVSPTMETFVCGATTSSATVARRAAVQARRIGEADWP